MVEYPPVDQQVLGSILDCVKSKMLKLLSVPPKLGYRGSAESCDCGGDLGCKSEVTDSRVTS